MKPQVVKKVIRASLAAKKKEKTRTLRTIFELVARAMIAMSGGIVLAIGLGLAELAAPARVSRALDPLGSTWNVRPLASMIIVVALGLVLVRSVIRTGEPLFAPMFSLPTRRRVDRDLVVGSVFAGAGLGATGLEPTTAVVALATFERTTLLHAVSMIAGMVLFELAWAFRRGVILPP